MKKIITLIIVSLIVFNSVVVAAKTTNEVMDSYEKEAFTLINIDIITDCETDEYEPYDYISKKEVLDMIGNLTNHGEITDYKAYAECLIGTSNLSDFQAFTYSDVKFAVSTALGALGYNELYSSDEYRKANDYITQAKRIGLLKGLNYSGIKSLRRCEAVKIIYNLMEASVLETNLLSNKGITYGQSQDSALYFFKKIYRVTDIINSVGYTSMYGESTLSKDSIMVGENTFQCNKDFSCYVGVNCDVYISDENNSVLSVYPEKGCDKITLDSDDFGSCDVSEREFTYYKNDKLKKVLLDKTVAVIKNGLGIKTLDENIFKISSGRFTLYDNDANGKYDVVLIYSAEYIIADIVSNTSKTVYNKLTYNSLYRLINLDESIGNKIISIFKEGKNVDFSDIKSGDLLEVYYNPDAINQTIRINITESKISGVVNSVSDDEVVISGKEYK